MPAALIYVVPAFRAISDCTERERFSVRDVAPRGLKPSRYTKSENAQRFPIVRSANASAFATVTPRGLKPSRYNIRGNALGSRARSRASSPRLIAPTTA